MKHDVASHLYLSHEARLKVTVFLLIGIKDANKYINRASIAISKRAMKSNHKMYATPLSISTNTLKIKHDELLNKINDSFKIMKK